MNSLTPAAVACFLFRFSPLNNEPTFSGSLFGTTARKRLKETDGTTWSRQHSETTFPQFLQSNADTLNCTICCNHCHWAFSQSSHLSSSSSFLIKLMTCLRVHGYILPPKRTFIWWNRGKKCINYQVGKHFFFHVVLLICIGTWRSDLSQLGPTQWFSEVKEEPQCVLLLSYFFSSSSVSESFFFYYDYFYFGFVLILRQIGKTDKLWIHKKWCLHT